jgi:hypothetical protein
VLGLWLEDKKLSKNSDFAEALALGFARFKSFLGAKTINAKAISQPMLRKRITKL